MNTLRAYGVIAAEYACMVLDEIYGSLRPRPNK